MLEKNRLFPFLVLFVVLVIPSLLFLSRDGFFGGDSYYFYEHVCEDKHFFDDSGQMPLEPLLWPKLPCNIFLLKLIIIGLFAFDLYFLFKIGELVEKGIGWLTLLFSFLCPALLFSAFKFENDAFGFPFVFAAIYFFLRYLLKKRRGNRDLMLLFACVCCIVLGACFWGGSFLLLIGFVFFEPLLLIVLVPLSCFFGLVIVKALLPLLGVGENNFGWGSTYMWLYVLHWNLNKLKDFWFLGLTLVFLVMGFVNPKFYLFSVPFLALSIVKVFLVSSDNRKLFLLVAAIGSIVLFSLALSGLGVAQQQPSHLETEAVQDLLVYGSQFDKNVANDWGLGYLVWYYGGVSEQYGGGMPITLWDVNNHVVLSRNYLNCGIIKEYDKPFFGNGLRIYDC